MYIITQLSLTHVFVKSCYVRTVDAHLRPSLLLLISRAEHRWTVREKSTARLATCLNPHFSIQLRPHAQETESPRCQSCSMPRLVSSHLVYLMILLLLQEFNIPSRPLPPTPETFSCLPGTSEAAVVLLDSQGSYHAPDWPTASPWH